MRKTFANTIRKDLIVNRNRRGVAVTVQDCPGGKLTYHSQHANADTAAYLNSKMPTMALVGPNLQSRP